MTPRVSVVIPCYNAARYLEQAVRSALSQEDVPDVEVVVVDDGSTDGSLAVAEALAVEDRRVRVLRRPHRGVCSTVNAGICEARSRIVALCGADDWFASQKLRLQLELLSTRDDAVLVYSDLAVVDTSGNIVHPSFWQWKNITPSAGRPLEGLLRGNFVSGGTMVFDRNRLGWALPMPEFLPFEDWWLATAASLSGSLLFCTQPLSFYRWHGNNLVLGVEAVLTPQEVVRRLKGLMGYYEAFTWLLDTALATGRLTLREHRRLRSFVAQRLDRVGWRVRRLSNRLDSFSVVRPLLGGRSPRETIGRALDVVRDVRLRRARR